jgi:hypothetical protein
MPTNPHVPDNGWNKIDSRNEWRYYRDGELVGRIRQYRQGFGYYPQRRDHKFRKWRSDDLKPKMSLADAKKQIESFNG